MTPNLQPGSSTSASSASLMPLDQQMVKEARFLYYRAISKARLDLIPVPVDLTSVRISMGSYVDEWPIARGIALNTGVKIFFVRASPPPGNLSPPYILVGAYRPGFEKPITFGQVFDEDGRIRKETWLNFCALVLGGSYAITDRPVDWDALTLSIQSVLAELDSKVHAAFPDTLDRAGATKSRFSLFVYRSYQQPDTDEETHSIVAGITIKDTAESPEVLGDFCGEFSGTSYLDLGYRQVGPSESLEAVAVEVAYQLVAASDVLIAAIRDPSQRPV